jgi:hypothetical protein
MSDTGFNLTEGATRNLEPLCCEDNNTAEETQTNPPDQFKAFLLSSFDIEINDHAAIPLPHETAYV